MRGERQTLRKLMCAHNPGCCTAPARPVNAEKINTTHCRSGWCVVQSRAWYFYSVCVSADAKCAVNKPEHSQHSGARRADEAAHRDVGVSHPGLVALEAVFVYSGLGQLPNLAGADLLVVPVLSVRHFILSGA